MADITITVTEITDAVSVEADPVSITVFDGVFVDSGGGGGGAVASVNGETGVVVLTASDVGADASGAAAAAQAASQPLDSDLTAIAALSTTTFGRALLELADAAAARSAIGAGTSSFDGAYSSLTGKPTLGTAAASDTTAFDAAGAAAAAQSASQPLDSALTAIAALATTTFGRSLLTQADAAAARTTLGAGTSSLAIGTSSSTAKAGDYQPASTNISDATTIGKTILTAADAAAVRSAISLGTAALISSTAGGDLSGTLPSPTVTKLNGTALSGLATGLLKNTTGTGVPSIAVAADIPNIAESQVTNLTTDLAAKAPLASPTFTGTPAAPTATGGTNTTQVATTAFVASAVSTLAPLASPTFTGHPVGVTEAAGNNSTRLATTAYVDGSFAPLASPALTGNPTATTQTAGNNSTRVATTAYADNAVAKQAEVIEVALSDETTAITTGTAKVTIRARFAFTLTGVRASLSTVSSSGLPTVDIKKNGTTVLSTLLTIDASEKTSVTAATAAVISTSAFADDDEITFDVTVAGTGAKGLKVALLVTRS